MVDPGEFAAAFANVGVTRLDDGAAARLPAPAAQVRALQTVGLPRRLCGLEDIDLDRPRLPTLPQHARQMGHQLEGNADDMYVLGWVEFQPDRPFCLRADGAVVHLRPVPPDGQYASCLVNTSVERLQACVLAAAAADGGAMLEASLRAIDPEAIEAEYGYWVGLLDAMHGPQG